MDSPALVLDFGGPVLLTPFELAADQPGTPAFELLRERGPLAPRDSPDSGWEAVQDGQVTERDYWSGVAKIWHQTGGAGPDVRSFMDHLFQPPRPGLIRDQARALIADARAAGRLVAILTNDMRAFHSPEWIDEIEIVDDVDVVVDGSIEGVLKPDPRLYEVVAERLEMSLAQMVFLDDQMVNIHGAARLGMDTVWFDVAEPDMCYEQVRKRLALQGG